MTNNNTSGQNGRRRVGRTIVLNGLSENRDGNNKNNKSSRATKILAARTTIRSERRKKRKKRERKQRKRLISSFQDSNGMANRL